MVACGRGFLQRGVPDRHMTKGASGF